MSFEASNLDEFATEEKFDALVGRYILLCQPNAPKTLRHLALCEAGRHRLFHDIGFPDPRPSYPPCPIYDQVLNHGSQPPFLASRRAWGLWA